MATDTEEFKRLNLRIKELERRNKSLKGIYFFYLILAVVLAAFIAYTELSEPPFGIWKQISNEKKQTEQFSDYLLSRIDSINRANNLLMENSPYYTGVFFEVQIGAFEHFDMAEYQEALENLRSYRGDSLNKYVLGKFRDYDRAKAFEKDIQRMGVEDAFIVGKINGKRVTITQALNAAKESRE